MMIQSKPVSPSQVGYTIYLQELEIASVPVSEDLFVSIYSEVIQSEGNLIVATHGNVYGAL